MRVAASAARNAEAAEPQITAHRPSEVALSSPVALRAASPTSSTCAAATPSGYGRSELVTIARRKGMVNSTPSTPPEAQIQNEVQNGKPVHQPTITRPGSTKMIADSVPAAEATVCTMLFSRIEESLNAASAAIEITAAGMEVAKVRPTLRPR